MIVTPHGTLRDAVSLDASMFFIGRKPRDVAAESEGNSDLARRNLQPGRQEGAQVNTTATNNRREQARAVADTLNILPVGEIINSTGETITTSRAKNGKELEFAPAQHYLIDDYGNAIKPNSVFHQKLEDDTRLVIDADGAMRTVLDSSAEISRNRRDNPDYSGVFGILGIREASTARNHLQPLTNTGEGMTLVTTYAGYERLNNKLRESFFNSGEPSVEDAEKLLQLDVQAALHPLVWSVDSYGVPVKTPKTLRAEMQHVVDHLPHEERGRLTEQYIKPYSHLLSDPAGLDKAIKHNGGREGWINPMQDWAQERLQDKYIVGQYNRTPETENERNYGHLNGDHNNRNDNDYWKPESEKNKEAKRVAGIYSEKLWNESIRPPTPTEARLGMGELHDVQGQRESNLAPARIAMLETLSHDPKAREAWINHQLATRNGLQNVSDLLFQASNVSTGNHSLLDFPDGPSGKHGAERLAAGLAGQDHAEDLMHHDAGFFESVGTGLVRLGTLGFVSLGKNANQNKGLFGFADATKDRWKDPATHDQVDASFKEVIDRAIGTEKAGGAASSIASTALVLTVDPHRAETERTQDTYDKIIAALPPKQRNTPTNQMVANLDYAGQRYVTVAVDRATKAGVLAGDNVVTVDNATAEQARVHGSVALTAAQLRGAALKPSGAHVTADDLNKGELARANGETTQAALDAEARANAVEATRNPGSVRVTTLSTRAARAARGQSLAVQSNVLATTDDPTKVSQNALNAHLLNLTAKGTPAGMATMVVGAIKDAEASGNQELGRIAAQACE